MTIDPERRLYLFNIARNVEDIRSSADLSESRVLNRLHGLGIVCTDADLHEALALATTDKLSSQGLTYATAADSINVPRPVFKRWENDGFPDGAPKVHSFIDTDNTARKRYYDVIDLRALSAWLITHPEVLTGMTNEE